MTDTDLADWLKSARTLTQAEVDQRTAQRDCNDLTADERFEAAAMSGLGR
ncbi:hypothetical protein ABIE67_009969 [Streptomyces sp. V4I8]